MGFVEQVRVGDERAKAGFGTEINCPSAILGAREIGRVGVEEDASA